VDPDPGSGAFLTPGPGSGIGFFRVPDLGSQTHIFKSLVINFWVKNSIIFHFFENWPKFFSSAFQNKIIFNFVKFVATKKMYVNKFFFHPSLLLLFLDSGSGMGKYQDP
jgi:hypothetical protein